MNSIRTRSRHHRKGATTVEAVLFTGTVFVIAMAFYWTCQSAAVGLFQVFSKHIGSPYM